MKKEEKYTIKEYLKAAEIGEVSLIDARHVTTLLEEARLCLSNGFECRNCKHSFSNPFDELFCHFFYDLDKGIDCEGWLYERRKKPGVSDRAAD